MDADIPVERFIDQIYNEAEAGRLREYVPAVLTGENIIKTLE